MGAAIREMKTVLLPVKDFNNAKQRLASALPPEQRAGLARAMFSDVLRALAECRCLDRVIVFTASAEAEDMARPFGFDVVTEESVEGHSAAVNHMLERLATSAAGAAGAASGSIVFSLALDLPKLTPGEIDFVVSRVNEPFTILPSREGTGTNGLVFKLPARIAVEYGEGSFRRHLSKAWAAGLRAEVLSVPGIAFDIDTPEDLAHFMDDAGQEARKSATWKYLSGLRQ